MNAAPVSPPPPARFRPRPGPGASALPPLPRPRPRLPIRPVLAALLWLACLAPSPAPAQTNLISARENDGQEVEVVNVFGSTLIPADGFMPLTVRLTNPGPRPREWNLSVQVQSRIRWGSEQDASTSYQATLIAPPGQTTSHEVMVPLPGDRREMRSLMVSTTLRTAGIQHNDWSSIDTPRGPAAVLVTQQVARLNLDDLNSRARSINSDWTFAARMQSPELPRDWRALIGWNGLLITEAEWDGLSPDQRLAVRQWLRLGGRLLLFTEGDAEALLRRVAGRDANHDLAEFSDDAGPGLVARFSLGRIEVQTWDGDEVDADALVERFRGRQHQTMVRAALNNSVNDHALLPPMESGNFLFGFLLVAYCVVIGPINLYLLAPASRRHRLFATTPLIAIAATTVLVLLGVLRDGVGLRGARSVVVELRPDESMAYLRQVQLYRSGMVGNTSFDAPLPMMIQPLAGGRNDVQRVNLRDNRWGGDLFGSRQRSGHVLAATRATRERLEWLPAGGAHEQPRLSSTLAWPLDELWVHSADGRWWQATDRLAPGGEVTLTEAEPDAAGARMAELAKASPIADHPHFTAILNEPGRFIGLTREGADEVAIPTLGSARWLRTEALTTGPVGGRTAAAPGATNNGPPPDDQDHAPPDDPDEATPDRQDDDQADDQGDAQADDQPDDQGDDQPETESNRGGDS